MIQGGKTKSEFISFRNKGKNMFGQPAFDVQKKPIDPIETTGGSDGFNFISGFTKDRPYIMDFTFVEEFDDYLECKYYTERVFVAKPPMLRMNKYFPYVSPDAYDGKYFSHIAHAPNRLYVTDAIGSEADETWRITPDYVEGDAITAINLGNVINIEGVQTYWQEIESNRVWALET